MNTQTGFIVSGMIEIGVVTLLSASIFAQQTAPSTGTEIPEPPFATQTSQIGAAEVKTVVVTGYFPERQPVIYWHDPEWKIDLVIPPAGSENDAYSLHILSSDGRSSTVEIPEVYGQINTIYRTPGDKVILDAICGGMCTSFLIVDLKLAKIIDDIGAEGVTISPNGRFILYLSGHTARAPEQEPSRYHLYDTAKTPMENYCGHTPINFRHEKLPEDWRGFRVYPQKPGQIYCTIKENDNLDDDNSASDFIWSSDSSKVIFADVKSGVMSLVLVKIPRDDRDKDNDHDRDQDRDRDRDKSRDHDGDHDRDHRGENDRPRTFIYTFTGTEDVCAGAATCDSNNVRSIAWNGDSVDVALIQVNPTGPAIEKDLTIPISKFVPIGK